MLSEIPCRAKEARTSVFRKECKVRKFKITGQGKTI